MSKPPAVTAAGPAGGTRTLKRPGAPNPAGAPKPAKRTSAAAPATAAEPVEVKPVEAQPAEPKPAEPKPAEPKPAEPKPAEPKPAEPKPAEPRPAEIRPAEPRPTGPKPVEVKPAEIKPAQVKPTAGSPAGTGPSEAGRPGAAKPAVKSANGNPAVNSANGNPAVKTTNGKPAVKSADGKPVARKAGHVPAREDGFPLWPDAGQAPTPAAEPKPPAGSAPWPAPQLRPGQLASSRRPPIRISRRRATGRLRPPAFGLALLLLFALLSGFFGWVSADPFWLSVGHAETGTARVTKCAGSGLGARCVGTFTGPRFSRERVALSALPRGSHRPGVTVPARMVSSKGRIAYVGNPAALHIRWVLGFVLVALCGVGIVWATGAGRLSPKRARMGGYATSIGAPLLLLIGMLVATW